MNRVSMGVFAAAMLAAGFLSAEDAAISSVSARQDWPWSGKVCIDFTVTGAKCDVKLTASFDDANPFVLDERHLSGDIFGVEPGRRHVEWDPVAAGYGNRTLTNFKVLAEPVDPNERLYMIISLERAPSRMRMPRQPRGGLTRTPSSTSEKWFFGEFPPVRSRWGIPMKCLHPSGSRRRIWTTIASVRTR